MISNRLAARFIDWIWSTRAGNLPLLGGWAVRTIRLLHAVIRDAAAGQINLRAMSLVYTTLLSIVPLLAFSFSVLKGFGVHNQVEPVLQRVLEPLGPRGDEVTANIIGFVDNIQVGVLGALGLLLLIYVVYNLLNKIEGGLNEVWHIRRPRSVIERFSNYLSVVLVGPLLIFGAMGLTATLTSHQVTQRIADIEPFGTLLIWASTVMPYVLVIGAFTFIYIFVPNTRVRFNAALTGAVIAGLAWQTTGWVFAQVVATSARYTAIYSGFAGLMFFIIWLYLTWLILLYGGKIAFYVQNPRFVTRAAVQRMFGHRDREYLALAVMYLIARAYVAGERHCTFDWLCRQLNVRGDVLEPVIDQLEERNLLMTADSPQGHGFVPGRDPAHVPVRTILGAVRETPGPADPDTRMRSLDAVANLGARLESSVQETVGDMNLREFVEEKG
jgi:membrane protein